MPAERLIKKYPHNRRLYDTSISDYITIDDIRKMVIDDIPFKVVDKKTNEDITRNILLQIIMEQESGKGEPMFSVDLLLQFIRNYGEATQHDFSTYMEKSLQFFAEQQDILREHLAEPLKNTPAEVMLDMGKKQMDAWQNMQKAFFEPLVKPSKKKR